MPFEQAELPYAESAGIQDKLVTPLPLSTIPDQPTMNVTTVEVQPKLFIPSPKPVPVIEPEPEAEDEITKMNRLHDELRLILEDNEDNKDNKDNEDNEDAFTPKHQDRILAKARQANTADGVERMVAYARKVLKNVASMAVTA